MDKVTTGVVDKGSLRHSRKLLIAGIAFLLVIGAAAAIYYFVSKKEEAAIAPSKVLSSEKVTDAYEQAYQGDYAEAQRAIDESISKASDPDDKSGGYMTQAGLAMNAGKYEDAKKYALKAEQASPTDGTAALLGDIAMRLGDKSAAQKYYQQAIDRLEARAKTPSPSIPQLRKSYATKLEAAKS